MQIRQDGALLGEHIAQQLPGLGYVAMVVSRLVGLTVMRRADTD